MKHHFVEKSQISGESIFITGEKAHHLTRVLRQGLGDRLNFFDEEFEYSGEITAVEKNKITVRILKTQEMVDLGSGVWLAQALPKAGKMDLIIQKNSEIGVEGILPFISCHCEAKISGERAEGKLRHWREVAVAAAEQCGRGRVLKIEPPVLVAELAAAVSKFDLVILLWEKAADDLKNVLRPENRSGVKANWQNKKILIITGPEGSFSEEEVNLFITWPNVKAVNLGPNILRTETAGLVAAAQILYEKI